MGQVILGIDPGNARCGWGVVSEDDEGALHLVECGCIETPKEALPGERLSEVYEGITEVIARHRPDGMAIEKLFFNRNITSAIAVAEARGVILLAAQQAGLPVSEYTPSEIKETMTGDGRAKKGDIGKMVVLTLGLKKKPTPDDTADAVAIAITHHFWGGLNDLR
ncbi:crossover junction endodeoxyribonuclease RuvC [bacterium]|nr:crossover junction endodeoxyribonuclease RuvC [bacterium]